MKYLPIVLISAANPKTGNVAIINSQVDRASILPSVFSTTVSIQRNELPDELLNTIFMRLLASSFCLSARSKT